LKPFQTVADCLQAKCRTEGKIQAN